MRAGSGLRKGRLALTSWMHPSHGNPKFRLLLQSNLWAMLTPSAFGQAGFSRAPVAKKLDQHVPTHAPF